MSIKTPYLLFLGDVHDQLAAKTAQGIVDWRPERCLAQLRLDGCHANLGIAEMSLAQAADAGAKTLIIGVVNQGGFLPDHWQATIIRAIELGMDVASGLHIRLGDIPAIKRAADITGARLFDVRHANRAFKTGIGVKRTGKRLLAVGTDCSCGKKYAALALERAMKAHGIKADFRATGQTGILIAGDGVAIDAVIADFISGAAEWLTPDDSPEHWDVIEGQGSLFHPAFAGVSTGLLHGSQPDALVLCHEPTRRHMRNLKHQPLPDIEICMNLNLQTAQLTNPAARFVGICVNTAALEPDAATRFKNELSNRTGLPALDPMIDDLTPIVDLLP